ncbi:MAG: hypothetical protein ACKV22_01665, partial [Bryobacteraceae bacterium]
MFLILQRAKAAGLAVGRTNESMDATGAKAGVRTLAFSNRRMILKPFSVPMQDDPEMDTLQRLPFGEKFSFRWGPQA